jgi:hypothetical protein
MFVDFEDLARFLDDEHKVVYGNILRQGLSEGIVGSQVQVLDGNPLQGLRSTKTTSIIREVDSSAHHLRVPINSLITVLTCFSVPSPPRPYSSALV